MARPSHRDKILQAGLRVVHQRGFGGASVRDITEAASVPQGSFTNHFASKEAFGLEVLELYYARSCSLLSRTLENASLPPLERVALWLDEQRLSMEANGLQHGCLIGNYSVQPSEDTCTIHAKLLEITQDMYKKIAACLQDAVLTGSLRPDSNCSELAEFLFSSLQGAILQAKSEKSVLPLQRFKQILFERVLT